MSESKRPLDPYLSEWNPQEYLRQYYSTAYLPDESQALLRFLIEQLSNSETKYRRAIDFGCGPALYTSMAIAPCVEELHLADYLPANLREVRRWLEDEPGAHNWDVYFRGVLELERGQEPTPAQIAARKSELRQKVTALRVADIRQPHPLSEAEQYDLVASFFCLEAVSADRREWETFLNHLSALVTPGGKMMLAAIHRGHQYKVLGRTFSIACVDENDFVRVLPQLGFSIKDLVVRVVPIAEWVEEGFDSICLVAATKELGDERKKD